MPYKIMERPLADTFRSFIPEGLSPDSPLPASNIKQASDWLSGVISGEIGSVRDGTPLSYLKGTLRYSQDPNLFARFSEVAGAIIRPVLENPASLFVPDAETMEQRYDTIAIFDFVPAGGDIPLLMFEAYNFNFQETPNPPDYTTRYSNRSLRRQMLLDIAASPPKEIEPNAMRDFFVREMGVEDGKFAVAGFAGLKRLSLIDALDYLPQLLVTLNRLGVEPHLPLITLLRDVNNASKDEVFAKLARILTENPTAKEISLQTVGGLPFLSELLSGLDSRIQALYSK